VVLPLIEESVVPVASKNINKGEIPEARAALAFSVSPPLVAVHDAPLGGGVLAVTDTVADWLALPPVPVQVRV